MGPPKSDDGAPTAGRLKRSLAELDDRVWEAAILLRWHASDVERRFSFKDLQALFAAYQRVNGHRGPRQSVPDEDTVLRMRTAKASFGGVRP